jgi:glycosyltransferase involved in cell wall biosynthesis
MRITVITPVFAIAGVPLAQMRLARAFAARGHVVNLMIGRVLDGYSFDPPENLKTTILNRPNVRSLLWPLVQYLSSEKPDVVFSAEDHLNTIVLAAAVISGSRAKISCSSRVTPFDTYSKRKLSKRWFLKQAARAVMGRADALTCVSQDMVKQYQAVFKNPPHRCVYNIVSDSTSVMKMQEAFDHPFFSGNDVPVVVAAGRLAPWKGFADLIDAMVLVCLHRPVRLLILGDGPLRTELQQRIADHGLEDAVKLQGYVENPLKYFYRADVFALSSLVEGLPNVLVEAMMCGCTPVATDCPTGPREVLADGRYGYLVQPGDPRSIADGILKGLDCRMHPKQLAEAVRPFEEDAVISRHFALLGLLEHSQPVSA